MKLLPLALLAATLAGCGAKEKEKDDDDTSVKQPADDGFKCPKGDDSGTRLTLALGGKASVELAPLGFVDLLPCLVSKDEYVMGAYDRSTKPAAATGFLAQWQGSDAALCGQLRVQLDAPGGATATLTLGTTDCTGWGDRLSLALENKSLFVGSAPKDPFTAKSVPVTVTGGEMWTVAIPETTLSGAAGDVNLEATFETHAVDPAVGAKEADFGPIKPK